LPKSIALLLLAAVTSALATDPKVSIRTAIEGFRAQQAAQAPRVGPVKDGGGFIKTQELAPRYGLEVPSTASPSGPVFANVEIATSLVAVRAATEEAVKQMPLSVMGPDVTTMVRRYKFEWTRGHWLLADACINLTIRGPIPGHPSLRTYSLPMKDKKMEPSDARTGSMPEHPAFKLSGRYRTWIQDPARAPRDR